MHHTSIAPEVRGNVAAHKPLLPYRGFTHEVQPRNRELATAVEIFFRTGDFPAFVATGRMKTREQQVMLLVYLLANDFAGAARECEKLWGIADEMGFTYAIRSLLQPNGREMAEALGWAKADEVRS